MISESSLTSEDKIFYITQRLTEKAIIQASQEASSSPDFSPVQAVPDSNQKPWLVNALQV